MKLTIVKVIGLIAALLLSGIAVIGIYFYVGLSGNPFTGWSEQRTCRSYYEQSYGSRFIVYDSHYDYKRRMFEFEVGPEARPEIRFTTSVSGMRLNDRYGARLAEYQLEEDIRSILDTKYGALPYTLQVSENRNPPDVLETAISKRISQNAYDVFVSWNDSGVSAETAENTATSMAEMLSSELKLMTKGLDLHVRIQKEAGTLFFYDYPIE